MSRKSVFFLCCYCGILIKSNINHLHRHEDLHKGINRKIKCAHINCNSTFANKNNYCRHWNKKHKNITMPDTLDFFLDMNNKIKVSAKNKSTMIAAKIESPYPSNDFYLLNALGLFHKLESEIVIRPDLNLTSEPCFGKLQWNDHLLQPIHSWTFVETRSCLKWLFWREIILNCIIIVDNCIELYTHWFQTNIMNTTKCQKHVNKNEIYYDWEAIRRAFTHKENNITCYSKYLLKIVLYKRNLKLLWPASTEYRPFQSCYMVWATPDAE